MGQDQSKRIDKEGLGNRKAGKKDETRMRGWKTKARIQIRSLRLQGLSKRLSYAT